MDDALTPEQKFAAEDAETLVPRALMLGRRPEEIVDDLVRLDWSRPAARKLVERVTEDLKRFNESLETRQQLIGAARKQFIGGLLAAVGGGVLALLALAGGGLFVMYALALFFVGLIFAGRGWSRWRFYKHLAAHMKKNDDAKSSADAQAARPMDKLESQGIMRKVE